MLGAIKDGILLLIDFITSIFEFLGSIITNTIQFVVALVNVVGSLPDYLDYFPAFILGAVAPAITIVIVLRVLGRD